VRNSRTTESNKTPRSRLLGFDRGRSFYRPNHLKQSKGQISPRLGGTLLLFDHLCQLVASDGGDIVAEGPESHCGK
jgi:hypothetical protein